VGIRPGLAETGNRAVDQTRIDCLERVVVETTALQVSNLEVLKQNVGFCREIGDQFLALYARQIDGDRGFVAVG